ncbi:PREDICTED: uncharacterized protein LOC107066579 [Polistes dominula]|uniref:Uncharacterized protein LOC107066579 n=1 Tax=Polistes dominula TaxID=743375 RepID=A0ABM1I9D4_POLDO|nr:PREDICTED: uncharacterized protein LOC107066579 [Polistes dominula]
MELPLRLVIQQNNTIYDDIILTWNYATKFNNQVNENEVQLNPDISNQKSQRKTILVLLNLKGFNAYLASLFVHYLIKSDIYRKAALQVLLERFSLMTHNQDCVYLFLMKLRTPKKQFLDYKWNERINILALEAREIDFAMSWLSTLGGAFSSLGEKSQHCAQMAGNISVKQYQLAMRLGNPLLVARCKLYAALSLIQQGYFKIPIHLIRNVYKLALDQKDTRLQNMCQGIWAKLQYSYKQTKMKSKNY